MVLGEDLGESFWKEPISRRRVLGAGGLAILGLVLPESSSSTSEATWRHFRSPEGDISIRYPAAWHVRANFSRALRHPKQTLALSNLPFPSPNADVPRLSVWPTSGVFVWLLHYPTVVDGARVRRVRLSDPTAVPSHAFPGFDSFVFPFAGSSRSYLLRMWRGQDASPETKRLLSHSLASLKVA
jgi:hypothetical protein